MLLYLTAIQWSLAKLAGHVKKSLETKKSFIFLHFFYKPNTTNTLSCPHPFQWHLPTSNCLKMPDISLKLAWQGLFPLLRLSHLKQRYLKNGNSDLKNSTTLQVANLILYNFYFMQRYIFRTPKGLKLQKKNLNYAMTLRVKSHKRPKANRPRNDSEAWLMFQSKANYILGKVKKLHCPILNRSGYR